MKKKLTVEKILEGVFENPTAPYRENWVLNFVRQELENLKVPYFKDQWGNIIAGTDRPQSLRSSKRIALMAHTDHPGFHVLRAESSGIVRARWFGGCPPKIKGASVAIHNPRFPCGHWKGRIVSNKLEGKKRDFKIKLETKNAFRQLDDSCFGAFDFPGFSKKGQRIFTRAADDLAGVVIILATFARASQKERKNMLGIFTRAEEVGFRGALGIIYKNILGPQNSVISLEASRQLPGARLGLGPVIRLGDKKTLFDSNVIGRLDSASAVLSKRKKTFTTQRRIMNGGTCEATAFNVYHIPAAGIAVPLGNYHNEKPNGKPGPEFINLKDVENAVELCVEFYRQLGAKADPTGDFIKLLEKGFKKDVGYLKKQIFFNHRVEGF